MNKKLSKEMKRSRLRIKFLNAASDLDRKASNKQRNYVVSLLRKEKKQFYGNLKTNIRTENRTFWKTVKPFLTGKTNKTSRITLIEEESVISKNQEYESFDSSEENPVSYIIKKYQNHQVLSWLKPKPNPKLLDLGN